MKEFTNKTIEEAIDDAVASLGVSKEKLIYKVVEEKKGLFGKKATIAVYDIDDASEYAQKYLKTAIEAMGIKIETAAFVDEDIIHITISSERNPALIGRGGRTLQALNELVRLAVSNKFQHRYRILLDVGGYKEDKYDKLAHIAIRESRRVLKTHVSVKLDPMTPDERRIVHNTLNGMRDIRTESTGEGKDRAVVIIYTGPKKPRPHKEKPAQEEEIKTETEEVIETEETFVEPSESENE